MNPPHEATVTFGQRFPELDGDVARLLDAAASLDLPPLITLSPQQARDRVNAGNSTREFAMALAEVRDLDIDDRGLRGRLYEPEARSVDAVLVYLHGGGWVTGDLGYSDEICRLIADRAACRVLSVDYRLAPEHPFPAAIDDALHAVDWVASGGLGQQARVVVAGDSAGGGLAAVCAQQSSAVVGQALFYPALDAEVSRPSYARNSGILIGVDEMTWFFDQYVPDEAQRSDPRFSALAGPVGEAPPGVIVVAGHDPLHDEGVAYAEALGNASVEVQLIDFPALPHGFLRFTAVVPAAVAAADTVADLVAGLVRQTAGI